MSRALGIMLALIGLLVGLLVGGRVDAVKRVIDVEKPSSGDRLSQVRGLVRDNFYRPPNLRAAETEALRGYVEGLGDPFSQYLAKEEFEEFTTRTRGSFSGIGVVLDVDGRIQRVYPSSPAADSGLRVGDRIVSVGGRSTTRLAPAALSELIRGPDRSSVTITVRRGRRTIDVTARRAPIEQPVVESRRFDDVLYVRLGGFPDTATSQLREALSRAEGVEHVVLDVRANGGGLLNQAVSISSLFLSKGQPILSSKGRRRERRRWRALADGEFRRLSVTMVIDKNTASASEILASALSEQRGAALVGTKSYGKGVVEEVFNLPGADALKLTVSEYLTSRDRRVQGVGIAPTVRLTEKELAEPYSKTAIETARASDGRAGGGE